MPIPAEYTFERYLSAKRSVDDRALNRYVWQSLQKVLTMRPPSDAPLRVLEIGAGIGTMVERIAEWGLTNHLIHYTAIDSESTNITAAHQRLASFSHFPIELEAINLFDFLARDQPHSFDLLIAHAFLDLIDLRRWLRPIFSLLKPSGLFYFTINFDGLSILEPPIDPGYDPLIMRLYHETMDNRIVDGHPSGDSRTGRHLFDRLRMAGASILAAGSSDWVVHPLSNSYPADEAYFLHFIVHTIDHALRSHPDIDPTRFADWIAARHHQIECHELIYIAHQIDFVGEM